MNYQIKGVLLAHFYDIISVRIVSLLRQYCGKGQIEREQVELLNQDGFDHVDRIETVKQNPFTGGFELFFGIAMSETKEGINGCFR
jgi:hypothetical protein